MRQTRIAILRAIMAAAALALLPPPALARGEPIAGPIAARVLSVVDGDTIEVRVRIWLDQDVDTLVRLDGANAPEMNGRCPQERARAAAAREFVDRRIAGAAVALTDIRRDKYGGRVLARVRLGSVEDLSAELIRHGHARAYAGGARTDWCKN
jgi:micrococcal nuclease